MPQKMIQSIYHFHSKEGNTMNKIYKVIWSKAKHTYVVASEIAKGHTKGETTGKGLKKLAAAMLVAAALLSPSFAWAADKATVTDTTNNTTVEVYTTEGADKQISELSTLIGNNTTNINTNTTNINGLNTRVTALETADKNSVTEVTGSDAKLTITKVNGSTSEVTIDNVNHATSADSATTAESATKATQDGNGNEISTTYATKTEVKEADEKLDSRITAVKEFLQTETENRYVSQDSLASELEVKAAGVVKEDQTIGENVSALGKALDDETNARIWADKSQDKRINEAAAGIAAVNTALATQVDKLNQQDSNEAATRAAKDTELENSISTIQSGNTVSEDGNYIKASNTVGENLSALDTGLNDRITAVKEFLQTETENRYVSKDSLASELEVKAAGVVKEDQTIGENVTALGKALNDETAARIGADAAQDKVIQGVSDALTTQVGILNQQDANELAGRAAADTKLVEATNGGLSLDNDNVLQKTKTEISSTGEVTTSKEAATTLVINKDAHNQVKIDSEGVTVGTSSTQMDAEGFTAGGHDYDAAGAALMSDGRIKGAKGAFTVDENGNVASKATITGETVTDGKGASMSNGTVTGKTLTDGTATISNGNIKTNGGFIQTGGGNVNTQGGEVRTNGGKVATSGGEINTGSGDIKTVGGNILTAGGKLNTSGGDIVAGTGNISGHDITASGVLSGDSLTVANGMTGRSLTLTGGDLDAGAGTIKTTGEVDAGTLNVSGKATVKDLEVKGEFKAETLTSWVDANNNTTINGGNVTSVNSKVDTDDGRTYTSSSKLTEKGRTDTAANGTTRNVSTQTASESGSTISSLADEKQKSYITQNLKKILQGIQNGDNATTVDQTETGIKSTATDGKNTASTNLSNGGFNTYATDGTNKTYTLQTAESLTSQIGDDGKVKSVMNADGITNNADGGTIINSAKDLVNTATGDITNTAKNGTITNDAKDLVNKATGDMTNTVGGKLFNDVIGDMENKVGGNLTTTVTGTSTETVTGKKTETYNGGLETTVTGEEKHTVNGKQTNSITGDQVNTIGGKLTTTVTGDVTEDYKANLSTTVGGNQATTVTGDSSLTAENISNEAKNKITNKALDVETDAKSSIVNKVSNDAGSNTSTQLSHQTTEEMSADGKTASYLRGAVEEKSQLTDGDKKTTIDTIAGQTNTNITDGKNISNSLQKADQAASSVTDGTNTTVVNQDAKSLASSITDGTKANNTNNTVDKSEQLIKADDTNYYSETKTAGSAVEALKSDNNTIIIAKDAATGTVSSAVTDGATITGISQNAKDINLSAAGGTIANSAKNINNTAAEKLSNSAAEIENKATTSINNSVGDNVSSSMTTNKITESVQDGTKSNTFTKTVDKDINIVTDGTNTSTESQLAGSVNTSLKNGTQSLNNKMTLANEAGKAEDVTKITDTASGAFSSSSQKADSITNTVKDGTNTSEVKQTASEVATSAKNITNTAEGGIIYNKSKDILNEASGDIINWADGEIGNVATKITHITGDNTVTSDTNGTTFENTNKKDKVTFMGEEKSVNTKETTISGNTITTGEAVMDYADVMKDLGVRGNATIKGDTTMEGNASVGKNLTVKGDTNMVGNASVGKDLTVAGKSTLTGDVTMKSNATVEKDLTVNGKSTFNDDVTMKSNATVEKDLTVIGKTTTETLVVNNGATIVGGATVTGGTTTDTLKVTGSSEFDGKATFNDIVTMNKGLSVTGGVTADSYKVDGKTYIDKDGINANGHVIKNVGKGDISNANSTDAVSGGQLYETNTRVSGLETRMGTVETKVDKLDNKIDKVGANAAAMANLHPLEFDEDSKWNIAAAVGSSGSETASAVGVFYRPNENVMVNVSAAMGTGENMFGGGVSLRLGHGGNKAKEAQMKAAAKENRELRAKVDDLTARMDALLSVLNPNMSKDFPDVPENHWAYEAVSRLAGNGIVEGYEDGKYHGERQMTRYEMAEIIYNALSKGAKAEKKLVEEFRPELQAMAAQKKA